MKHGIPLLLFVALALLSCAVAPALASPAPVHAATSGGGALSMAIVAFILLATYVIIAIETWHRTLTAMTGGSLLLLTHYIGGHFDPALRILDFGTAMAAIDWNVIFLLLAMMIIVGVLKETGVFQWFSYKCFQLSGGSTFRLAAFLMVLTAVASANLDNVTTMLLVAPVSIATCRVIGVNPLALLLPETLASNIGGMATLIGDPPNIMIGSHAGLSYVDFLVNLGPPSVIIFIVHLFHMRWVYRKDYAHSASREAIRAMLEKLRRENQITDRVLLAYGAAVLGAVIVLFFCHSALGMPVAVPALAGASVLLVLRDRHELRRQQRQRQTPGPVERAHGILMALEKEVEWPTLIFFAFLFIIVGAAEQVGLIREIAELVRRFAGGSLLRTALLTLWISAVASAFVDNIPFTATMLPLLTVLGRDLGPETQVLWWALALGACLGGNGTLIGASANVVTAGIAEKEGVHISFRAFFRVGFPAMILQVGIATIWLLVGRWPALR